MAKKSGKSGIGGLGTLIFLIIAPIVALTAGAAIMGTYRGADLVREKIGQDLRRSHAAHVLLQQKSLRELELQIEMVRESGDLAELLITAAETGDAEPLKGRIDTLRQSLGSDLLLVLDATGRSVGGEAATVDPAADPLLGGLLNQKTATGLWTRDDVPYHAAAAKLVQRSTFEQVGYVMIGRKVVGMAAEIERTTGIGTTLFLMTPTGPAVLSTSLGAEADALVPQLRLEARALAAVERGEVVEDVALTINDEPWRAFLAPMRDVGNEIVLVLMASTAVADRLAVFEQTRLFLFGLGGAALAVVLLASGMISRLTLAPVRNLAVTAGEIARGNYKVRVPSGGGNFGAFSAALTDLKDRLYERQATEDFVLKVSRGLPEPARVEAAVAPATPRAAMVGVEMQRFANPKIAFDPEENVSRLARDLRRIATAVKGHQGKLESILGHRLLAVFEGDGASQRAFAAATEILLILTTRENAFDEPVAPAIGLASGPVVSGAVSWTGHRASAYLGLPVRHLESLMREITPGDLYMTKPFASELANQLKAAEVPILGQRGLVTQQTLYVVKLADAQRYTGAQPPVTGEQTGGHTATKRTLADVTMGEVLAGRFEVLAELGSGPLGLTCKCLDRHRGDMVTLKLLRPEIRADAQLFDRLRRGIGQARLLSHDNVLSVLDMGEVDGLVAISSQFVRGMSLRYVLDQGRVPTAAAIILGRQILAGLAAAHRSKVIHGGLKPENVIVDPLGARVMDFAHALPLNAQTRDQPSPAAPYLAPEQVEGRDASSQSDLFAWGALFYEMAAGKPPVAGSTPSEVASQRLLKDPEPLAAHSRDLPAAIAQAVLQCLKANPAERPASADEFLQVLAD